MSLTDHPKALLFDVFGTLVDWRTSITSALVYAAQAALATNSETIPAEAHQRASRLTEEDWGAFAQQWRNSYMNYTVNFRPGEQEFITVDEHHYISLKALLAAHQLEDLFTEEEIKSLSLQWHYLDAWEDSSRGLKELNKKFVTSTLSNGNTALLRDLARYTAMPFKEIISAAEFGAYKPNPAVYLGGAANLGLEPSECAMVAAHIGDLAYAKESGFQTIYIPRPQEETHPEFLAQAKSEGTVVDMWIDEEQDGLLEIARRYGIVDSGV